MKKTVIFLLAAAVILYVALLFLRLNSENSSRTVGREWSVLHINREAGHPAAPQNPLSTFFHPSSSFNWASRPPMSQFQAPHYPYIQTSRAMPPTRTPGVVIPSDPSVEDEKGSATVVPSSSSDQQSQDQSVTSSSSTPTMGAGPSLQRRAIRMTSIPPGR